MTQWTPGWSPHRPGPGDRVVTVQGNLILPPEKGWFHPWETIKPAIIDQEPVYVGQLGDEAIYVAEVDSDVGDLGAEPVGLREALMLSENAPVDVLSTAVQVFQWWRDHQFCGRCGSATDPHPQERAKWCQSCGIPWYPRLAPCVIVLIRRDDRMLLARSSRTKLYFFSLIAGFVEPGESIEGAVAREVKEETGLDVTNIRYQSSQPWPFPHQLMLGFFADYAGGDLVLQEDELAEAGWYEPGALPPVPPQTTIAGRLIRSMEDAIRGQEGLR